MAPKGSRSNGDETGERRRSADRRAAPREGSGGARGRRAADRGEPGAREAVGKSAGAGRKRRSTRDGREPLVIYLRPESIRALKIAAIEEGTTASAIMADALEAWVRTRR